jgi:hypothetical protein
VRICIIYALISTLCWQLKKPPAFALLFSAPEKVEADKILIMMIVYLPLIFAWEIFQLLPEENFFRGLPSYFQNISCPFALITAFFGAYTNFYYDVWWWDKAVHLLGGGIMVILGYEVCAGIQRKRKQPEILAIVLLASVGMSFLIGTVWEAFEFAFDQFFGGDTQHWNLRLAQEAGMTLHVFPPPASGGIAGPNAWQWEHRFALADTMGDMLMNMFGAFGCLIGLRIFPYYHKGKNNLNTLFALTAAEEAAPAAVFAVK